MRPIKFRAWDKKRNQMHYNIEAFDVYQPVFEDGEEYTFAEVISDTNFNIMQFTGLVDKNKKEIYESDIVKQDGITGVVVYSRYGFFVEWIQNAKARITLGSPHPNSDDHTAPKTEVIGDIHTNPELLK